MDGRTEGREKQKGGILKEVGMKTEEEVKVAMEEGGESFPPDRR